ncbi:RNA polymerase subunit sigma-70 [Actinomadura sp. CNU-125]|nr:RNA polymerase subunit sigma-70 [Actinomadura sp. CNU-125]
MEELGEAELAARVRSEPDLFTVVYDRYHRDIYQYVAGRLDVHAGEDVTAEVFLTAFARRHRFDPERGTLRPWLFGIATNLVARHRRTEARHYRALTAAPELPAGGHEDRVVTSVAAQHMQPKLAAALRRLSRGERDVVLLLALAQLTHQEIAQALGISYGTVGSRLSRARKKLTDALDREALHG